MVCYKRLILPIHVPIVQVVMLENYGIYKVANSVRYYLLNFF